MKDQKNRASGNTQLRQKIIENLVDGMKDAVRNNNQRRERLIFERKRQRIGVWRGGC